MRLLCLFLLGVGVACAQAPAHLNYQGRITVQGVNFDGTGQFKFALVTPSPVPAQPELAVPVWSNAGALLPGAEPSSSVALPVTHGLYAVRLGDTSIAGMAPFSGPDTFDGPLLLRVWFDDGVHGFQLLTPDQPLASAPYALRAGSLAAGAVGQDELTDGAISSAKLATGAVTGAALASAAVGVDQLADGSVTAAKLATANAPANGQVLAYSGGGLGWVPAGLTLPFSSGATSANAAFSIQNNDAGPAITGYGTDGDGVTAYAQRSTKSALYGQHNGLAGGQAVYGYGFFNANGVLGVSNQGDGVSGRTNGTGRSGVYGFAEGADSSGLHGYSALHHGVYAFTGSTDRPAIWADAPNGAEAIHGHSNGGDGVVGFTQSPSKAGVFGFSVEGNGVVGFSGSSLKSGVYGWSDKELGYGGYFYNSHPAGKALRVAGDAKIDGLVTAGNVTAQTLGCSAGLSVGGGLTSLGGRLNSLSESYLYNYCKVQGDLDVSEQAYKHGDYTWDVPSDERLKTVEGAYGIGLAEINRLRTVRFHYNKDNPFKLDDTVARVGVVAQELQAVIPAAVREEKGGYLTVNVDPVLWALVNSVQELKRENDTLKQQLAEAKALLLRRIEALEAAAK